MEAVGGFCNTSSVGPFNFLFTSLIATLAKSKCDISGKYPVDYGEELIKNENTVSFDFIVVGSGSSGSVIANRLTEIPDWNVLLIEAGGDPPLESDVPALFHTIIGTEYDWQYKTVKSEHYCKGYTNGQCNWPRGKFLGGCSSINAMLYVRGNKRDYDLWESLGNDGWGYEDVLRYFKKSERFNVPEMRNDAHGYDGYLNVEMFKESDKISSAHNVRQMILDAAADAGIPFVHDINADQREGVTVIPATVKNGERWNAAKAFLTPIKDRPNLFVAKKTTVTKLLIENKTAFGVEIFKNGIFTNVMCKKEVIVSAGAINSPQLLMLSGIGPKDHLDEMNIETIQDLNVGQNLQDHAIFHEAIKLTDRITPEKDPNIMELFLNYLTNRTDLGSIGVTNTILFLDTTNSNPAFPDIQIHYFGFPLKSPELVQGIYSTLLNGKQEYADILHHVNNDNYVLVILPTLLRPKSRGKLFLKSKNPFDYPNIVPEYMNASEDVETLIRSIRFIEKLLNTPSMRKYNASFVDLKASSCVTLEMYSDEFWECLLRQFVTTIYHPAGTCKMAPKSDPHAVVNSQLKVYGITGLRVADASIMPNIVSGNLNIPCVMIGEKASDLIKDDWLKSNNHHSEL